MYVQGYNFHWTTLYTLKTYCVFNTSGKILRKSKVYDKYEGTKEVYILSVWPLVIENN